MAWAGPIYTAGKNVLINGGMDIWQRSTSSTTLGYATADRFWCNNTGGTSTISQSTTYLPVGLRYALKMVNSSGTYTTQAFQAIETANTVPLAGQTVTLSAYYAADSSTNMSVILQYSTSVDNAVSGSWTSISPTSGGSGTVSTAMARVSGVFAIPSSAQSLRVVLGSTSAVASGVATYVTGAQLELGSVATTFSRAGGTLQGELAAAQRYYYRLGGGSNYDNVSLTGFQSSSTLFYSMHQHPVSMRISQPALDYSSLQTSAGVAVSLPGAQSAGLIYLVAWTTGSTSIGNPIYLRTANTTSGYLGFSAEL
jgi:hypothetical protein